MLAFIVGLAAEASLLRSLRVRVFIGGGTAGGAGLAVARALAEGAEALVSFGLAGGLSPVLQPGAIIVPEAVLVHDRRMLADAALSRAVGGINSATILAGETIVGTIAGKAERWAGTRADAVDLESGAVADAAERAGRPFAVLRAICDPAGRGLPPAAIVALDQAGAIGLLRVAASVLRHPGQIGGLVALSRDAASARRALAERVATLQGNASLAPWIRNGG